MANINKELNNIKNAVYGKEVRGSIHDGIKKINEEVEDSTEASAQAKHQVENIQEQVDNLVVSGDSSVEAAQARVDKDNHNYSTLKERLDTEQQQFETQLADTEQDIHELEQNKVNKTDFINAKNILEQSINERANKHDVRYRNEPISEDDLTTDLKEAITGNADLNLLSIPQDNSVDTTKTTFAKTGKNLVDKHRIIEGYFVHSGTGDLQENPDHAATNFISIRSNVEYISSLSNTRVAFYDKNRSYISGLTLTTREPFKTPSEAKYLRASILKSEVYRFQIEEGTVSTPYEPFLINMDSVTLSARQKMQLELQQATSYHHFLQEGKNLLNIDDMIMRYRLDTNTGDLVNSSTNKVTRYILIKPNTKYSISNNSATIAFYNENGLYIEGISSGGDKTFTTPSKAKFIRLSFGIGFNTFQLEENNDSTTVENYYFESDKLRLKESNFRDNSIPLSALKGDVASGVYKPTKYPSPATVEPEYLRPLNNSYNVSWVAEGYVWSTLSNNKIYKSVDGESFESVADLSDEMNESETINQHALIISDTGRIIVATSQGRVLVSDENKENFEEAFTYKAGYTPVVRGYDKQGKYILMGSYGSKGTSNPPREVYMSKNHGETWELIFDKSIDDMINPQEYHIHAVAFDPYSQCIIISIGDNENRQIEYSYDFGETWHQVFDENEYGEGNWAPIHPTDIQVYPEGYAFGSDEPPEGISWWNRPDNEVEPVIKWEDIEYKIKFGEYDNPKIGTYAMHSDTLQTESGFYGVMAFRDHQTETQGNPRLFVTGDGGRSWHQIFKQEEWDSDKQGFMNALLKEENGDIFIYSIYSRLGTVYIFKAKMPKFLSL